MLIKVRCWVLLRGHLNVGLSGNVIKQYCVTGMIELMTKLESSAYDLTGMAYDLPSSL